MKMTKGTELHPDDKRHVLAAYVHRFTGEHKPQWACSHMPNGEAYKVQFANDQDWLANTLFACRSDGRLDGRVKFCRSNPTWPNNS